jgi:hypothetical protein
MAAEPAVAVAAIVAIAIIVVAVLPIGILTSRMTSTYVTMSTMIAATATLTNFPSGRLYDVTFYDGGPCPGEGLTVWGVQLGNQTITQPSGIHVSQIPEDGLNASGKLNMTTVVFSVPSGTYPFTLYPTAFLRPITPNPNIGNLRDASGTVTVINSSVTIRTFAGIPTTCY